ncbi:MAG: DNA replication/repair protein RecF [Gammaproteobacteria bacterium]|nr:DNA replication/repair protein RecF [Gammaproteobacteria bacterium]
MSLTYLEITDLRNLPKVVMEPSPRFNIIIGANGSGKTSLLEAIYLLGRGRSFRTAYGRRAVREGQTALTVFGRTSAPAVTTVGIQIKNGALRAKIGGEWLKKVSELASVLPLLFISPDADKLIKGSPRQRRRFLDWGLFHVEPSFLGVWQRYNRALLQHNAEIQQSSSGRGSPWAAQLAEAGIQLHQLRQQYALAIQAQFDQYLTLLSPISGVDCQYQAGWPAEMTLAEALDKGRERDRRMGFTQNGPHRAELALRVNGRPAEQFLSGGQQKLVACALLLAQAAIYRAHSGDACLLLVDDLPAELDPRHRRTLLELLYQLGGQVFITATDSTQLPLEGLDLMQMFHVEHGVLQTLK